MSTTPVWPELQAAIQQAEQHGALVGVAIETHAGQSFAHRATRRFRAASTVKIPLMIALLRQVDQGQYHLTDTYTVTAADKTPGSGVLQNLHDDLVVTYHDLLYLTISISDNTATNILIDRVGMAQVNATINDLGLTDSNLGRKMRGRPAQAGDPENWATARDYQRVLQAVLGGDYLSANGQQVAQTMLQKQENPRRIARYLPTDPAPIWGSKNGSLAGVANDVGYIHTPGGTVLLSIFTEGFPLSHTAEKTIGLLSRAALLDTQLLEPLPVTD